MASPRPSWIPLLLLFLWLAGIGWGFHGAFRYEASAGAVARNSTDWPEEAPFERDPGRCTLVLAAHPRCPCTRATLEELERLLARCGSRLSVHILFYSDPTLGHAWERTDLWARAAAIPGADVRVDSLGATSSLFGARTSGQTFLFGRDGRLLFEGGITLGRGHAGDNPGAQAIADWVNEGRSGVSATPVFGCPLSDEEIEARS